MKTVMVITPRMSIIMGDCIEGRERAVTHTNRQQTLQYSMTFMNANQSGKRESINFARQT